MRGNVCHRLLRRSRMNRATGRSSSYATRHPPRPAQGCPLAWSTYREIFPVDRENLPVHGLRPSPYESRGRRPAKRRLRRPARRRLPPYDLVDLDAGGDRRSYRRGPAERRLWSEPPGTSKRCRSSHRALVWGLLPTSPASNATPCSSEVSNPDRSFPVDRERFPVPFELEAMGGRCSVVLRRLAWSDEEREAEAVLPDLQNDQAILASRLARRAWRPARQRRTRRWPHRRALRYAPSRKTP
jgi:hypothetical protein